MAQHVPSRQLVAIKSVDFDKCELPYSLVQVHSASHPECPRRLCIDNDGKPMCIDDLGDTV